MQVTILEDYRPSYAGLKDHPGLQLCWLNNKLGFGMFFALPVAALILENMVFFVISVVCWSQEDKVTKDVGMVIGALDVSLATTDMAEAIQSSRNPGSLKRQRRMLAVSALGFFLTANWLTSFLAIYTNIPEIWYAFIAAHGLQGISIFILFDIKRKVYYAGYKKIMGTQHPTQRKSRKKTGQSKPIQSFQSTEGEAKDPNDKGTTSTANPDSNPSEESLKVSEESAVTARVMEMTRSNTGDSSNDNMGNHYARIRSRRNAFSLSSRHAFDQSTSCLVVRPLTAPRVNHEPKGPAVRVKMRRSRSARDRQSLIYRRSHQDLIYRTVAADSFSTNSQMSYHSGAAGGSQGCRSTPNIVISREHLQSPQSRMKIYHTGEEENF